jgi:hypothetical protein
MPVDDIVAIEQLRGNFADRAIRQEYDRFAALFTDDGVWAIPGMGVSFQGRTDIRAGIERMRSMWEFFVQTVHPGAVEAGSGPGEATGRCYVSELGRFLDGTSQLNYACYEDRYLRLPEGWRFASRRYRFLYVDTSQLIGKPTA